MSDKISVLIPVFNRELYIEEAVKSIQNQTYKNLDIIIYSDGSSDNTNLIVEKIMKTDNRIKLIIGKENKGVGHARNILLEACKTRYAVWHDSDDISHPDRIQKQSKYLFIDTLVFCYWSWLKLSRMGWKPDRIQKYTRAFATILFPVNKRIKFKENMIIGGEDWDWIKRMKRAHKMERVVDKLLYYVRFHNDRIGEWKRKIRAKISKELQKKLSYKELIEYYKEHYE